VGEDIGNENRPFIAAWPWLAARCKHIDRDQCSRRRHRPAVQRNLRQLMLVRVADDQADPCQGRDFFGSPLRIAAGHDDLCLRILPLQPADGRACILVGRRRNRARIQHHHGGMRRGRSASQTMLFELAFESGAVGLRGPASEVFYIVGRHFSMVAQTSRLHRQSPRRPGTLLPWLAQIGDGQGQAVAAVLRDWKHSRQNTGRPWVGRKGTVVCFPHPEQVAWVSTLV